MIKVITVPWLEMVERFSGNWILSYFVRVSNLVQDHSFQRSHERREPQRLKGSGLQIHRGTWNLQCRVLGPAVKLGGWRDLTKILEKSSNIFYERL